MANPAALGCHVGPEGILILRSQSAVMSRLATIDPTGITEVWTMPTDAEIELATAAIRSIRVKGAKVHDEVVRAYARAAVEAAERARLADFQRRSRLANEPKPAANNQAPGGAPSGHVPRCAK